MPRFDPSNLDSTVIAVPLLKKIEEERALIKLVRDRFPSLIKQFNSVIFLPPSRRVTSPQVRSDLDKLLDEAAHFQKAGAQEPLAKRLGRKLPGYNGLFAWLDARTIQRLFTTQDAARARGKELPLIVERILPSRFRVIIDLNLEFIGGRDGARQWVEAAIPAALAARAIDDPGQFSEIEKSRRTGQYVFATLEADVIAALVQMDAADIPEDKALPTDAPAPVARMAALIKANILRSILRFDLPPEQRATVVQKVPAARLRAIHRIWPDFEIKTRIINSISTVKANAAINSFAARGAGITWAVMDTGIQGDHPHFLLRKNIVDAASPLHEDFTASGVGPLIDASGHGTHVAGIIAGEWRKPKPGDEGLPAQVTAVARYQDEHGDEQQESRPLEAISGMAPDCRLVSLKVLDENGIGSTSNIIAAIAHVQETNGFGRRLLIHGVNISAGYPFDPKWFACGQSPLCVEVDRLVKSGVVVVVAAGNTGYGSIDNGNSSAGLGVTINDPGNADLAITVGATHRDMPHTYGVSYFSSKGPTGDGRLKPDLVAPGEKIISCASSLSAGNDGTRAPSELKREVAQGTECDYIETSGTSMAAPHVSGLAAAFLSVRREYIGKPERVKEIFLATCTDLKRDRYFQGAGLVDLMRAIQSV